MRPVLNCSGSGYPAHAVSFRIDLNFSDESIPYVFANPENNPGKKLLDAGEISCFEEKRQQHRIPELITAGSAIRLSPWNVVVYEISS